MISKQKDCYALLKQIANTVPQSTCKLLLMLNFPMPDKTTGHTNTTKKNSRANEYIIVHLH